MKKIAIIIAMGFITIITVSSCKKGTTSSPYYIKATINGVNVVYNGYTAAYINYNGLSIYGYNNTATTTSDGININFSYNVATNLYPSIGNYSDTSTAPGHLLNILTNLSGLYYRDNYSQVPAVDNCNVTITAIDSLSVSGTFTAITSTPANNKTEIITNGSFYVPF